MTPNHLILSGHHKGSPARIIPGSERRDELGRESVMVELRDRLGRRFLRRMKRSNLVDVNNSEKVCIDS